MKFAVHDWPVISALFDEALDLPPERRSRWLDELPEDARRHRHTLEQLLSNHASVETQDFLYTLPKSAVSAEPDETSPADVDRSVGPYRLLHELGRGGMGSVWLAERSDGLLKRQVALKLPHPGLATRAFAERLARERDILASLAHPNIARLYDAGVTAQGQPYIALAYVQGRTLIEHCDARRLSVRERISLFQQVLQAVQYAHAHLVVHRDLKPSNVLVDENGQVHLLDFGIAKLLVDGQAEATELTLDAGQAITPDYASPEQLAGTAISTASDVYSLGVLLYELLAGVRPYRLRNKGDLAQTVREIEIARPSTAVVSGRDARALRGDLDVIVLKALKKDPVDRYATVEAMQQDLQRHLAGELVLARPDSAWLRIASFVRRHRAGVAVTAVLSLALTAGLGGTTWQAQEARRQAEIARNRARMASASQQFMESVFRANSGDQADPQKARDMTARQLLDIGASRIDKDLRDAPEAKLSLLKTLADMYEDMGLLDDAADLSQRRVAMARQVTGERSEATAEALVDLGEALTNLDRRSDAVKALSEAGKVLDLLRLGTSPTRVTLDIALSKVYLRIDANLAVAPAQRALAVLRTKPPSVELVKALNNLGTAQAFLDQNEAALATLTEAETLVEAHPDLGHSSRSAILTTLARTQDKLDQLDAAAATYRKAVDVDLSASGPDALNTQSSRSALSGFLRRNSRLREAVDVAAPGCRWAESPAAAQAASVYREQLLFALECGFTLMAYGRTEQAMAALNSAAALSAKQHEPTDLSVMVLLLQARGWTEEGSFEKARSAIERAQEVIKQAGPAVAQPQNLLDVQNRLLMATGRAAEALSDYEASRVRQGKPALPPPQSPPIALSRSAELYLANGRLDVARDLARNALSTIAHSPNKSYLVLAEAQSGRVLGRALLAQGDAAAALPVLEHAVDVNKALYDPQQSLVLAEVELALAECQAALGDREALRHTTRAVEAILAQHRGVAAPIRASLERLQAATAGHHHRGL